MKRFVVIAIFLPFLLAALVLTEDELQLRIKEVAKTLRCAVCQSESVWDSNAELALQMREIIRERVIQGESPAEIRAYFQSRYGDFILLQPQKRGMNWLLWGGPFLLLFSGGAILFRYLKQAAAEPVLEQSGDPILLDPKSRERIDQAMKSWNG